MKVWIDGSAFENTGQHGIWRVFYEIMSRTAHEIDYTLWLRDEPRRPIPAGVQVYRDDGRAELPRHQLVQRWQRRHQLRHDPPGLRQADLFHSTGFTVPLGDSIPAVVTVHDMIAESHFPICIRELEESIEIKRRSLARATKLPCDSECTARELASFYPEFADKARVVRHGCEHLLDALRRCGAAGDHDASAALFVGQRKGYKNFLSVLHALADPHWPPDVLLHVIGPPLSDAEQRLIAKLGLSRRIRERGTLSDEELSDAYRTSRCLIFPSFQEGFGLPCLEAQVSECVLVCSDIPVFREVAGEAAIYFDPRLHEQIADAVARAGDVATRKRLIVSGKENIKRFSWDDSARGMLELYQTAVNG